MHINQDLNSEVLISLCDIFVDVLFASVIISQAVDWLWKPLPHELCYVEWSVKFSLLARCRLEKPVEGILYKLDFFDRFTFSDIDFPVNML